MLRGCDINPHAFLGERAKNRLQKACAAEARRRRSAGGSPPHAPAHTREHPGSQAFELGQKMYMPASLHFGLLGSRVERGAPQASSNLAGGARASVLRPLLLLARGAWTLADHN